VRQLLAFGLVIASASACGRTIARRAPSSSPTLSRPTVSVMPEPELFDPDEGASEIDKLLFAVIDLIDLMDAVGRDAIDAPPHGVPSKAPCPIDTSPVRDPATREQYANHRFAMVTSTMAGGHARYAATIAERIQVSMSAADWPQPRDLLVRVPVPSAALRDVDRASLAPISYRGAVAELSKIADPAWWTWDLVVIFSGGGNRPDGAHLSGHAYVIDYQLGRAVCLAYFDVRVGEAWHYDQERAVDAVLPLLRALR
jgi:hypothetical protein